RYKTDKSGAHPSSARRHSLTGMSVSWSVFHWEFLLPGPTLSIIVQSMRRAVIDVGTNSVKLLVADVEGARVQQLLERSEQTRLGQGFYETHQLQSEPITLTARAVAEFAALARQWQASSLHVIGTSAARDALNKEELALAIKQASGLALEV